MSETNETTVESSQGKELWVWMFTSEDTFESATDTTLWSDKEKAKAAMEKGIERLRAICGVPRVLVRDDDEHAHDDRFCWSIKRVKVD